MPEVASKAMLGLEVGLYSSRVTLYNLVQIQLVAADLAQ